MARWVRLIQRVLPEEVEFINADAGDPLVLQRILPKVDYCIHLAAMASIQAVELNWMKAMLLHTSPLGERQNKIVVVIKPENEDKLKKYIFGMPVKISF